MMKSYIQIYRLNYVGCFRAYPIYIDAQRVGKIKYKETIKFEVSPGVHRVRTRFEFARSNMLRIDVPQGECIFLTIDRKYISFWKKLMNLLCFAIIMTIGSFFGSLGLTIGAGSGSFFLLGALGHPYIYAEK